MRCCCGCARWGFFCWKKIFFGKRSQVDWCTICFVWRKCFGKPQLDPLFFGKWIFWKDLVPEPRLDPLFFCLKNNFLESLGPGFFLLQKKQQLTCGMRGWVGTFLFVINRFFLESWMDAQFFLVWRRIFWKARGHASVFFLLKKYAINLRNALLLSRCARWGFFCWKKIFFGKPVPSGLMHNLFCLKKNFLESPGRGSCGGFFFF